MATKRKPPRPPAKASPDHPRVPQKHGGALLRGGVKGNRSAMSHKRWLAHLLRDPQARDAFEAVMRDPSNPQAVIQAHKFARETVYGRPSQQVEHSGNVVQQAVIILPAIEVMS